jgi:putative ABC transport system permease protein
MTQFYREVKASLFILMHSASSPFSENCDRNRLDFETDRAIRGNWNVILWPVYCYLRVMRPLYLRLFLRIIKRNRDVYILKILTLSIAFACAMVITLFAFNEFGYDRFHSNADSVFRILRRNNSEDFSGNRNSNRIPETVVTSLRSLCGDSLIISAVKVIEGLDISFGGKTWRGRKLHAANASIADIFTFDLAHGSWTNFTVDQPSIILSTTASLKYFGIVSPEGKTLKISTDGDTIQFRVAAVFNDFPANSHEDFEAFISFDSTTLRALNFDPSSSGVYGRVMQRAIDHFQKVIDDHIRDQNVSYTLQPLPEIYFGPRVIGEDAKHGDVYSIYILICITCLILFLAITGFVNLTTITIPHRSKELAIKKMAGMNQVGLLSGFAKESFIIVALSLAIGIVSILLLEDSILPIISIDVVSPFARADPFVLVAIGTLFVVFVLSPLFLTVKFTRASPNRLLSSESITFPRFKRIIAFLQLGISLFLIVASLVIRRQVNYSLVKEPGQNHDQVAYLDYPHHLSISLTGLRSALKMNSANIVDVIAMSQLPQGIKSKELGTDFFFIKVDSEFKDFFDLKMVEGHWFKANDGDSIIVVNEKAKQLLGSDTTNVIGTFGDIGEQFNLPEKPLKIFRSNHFEYNFLYIRLLEVDVRRTVSALSTYFAKDGKPATIRFLNARFEQWLLYQDRLNQLSEIMAIISGLLACCGIYGLCVSLVREKIKQIALHKLYGARAGNITILLVKEFALQLAIAAMVFGPVTYLVLQEMLRSFIYRTHFVWLDPIIPLLYCVAVITLICNVQANRLNQADLTSSLKA